MDYRDDRAALHQQLDALRREVEDLRAASTDGADNERVSALSKEVAAVLARLDGDREALQKLAASLASLRESRGTSSPATSEQEKAAPSPSTATAPSVRNRLLLLYCGAAAMVACIIIWIAGRPDAALKKEDPLRGIPGAPQHVDPSLLLPRMEALAPNTSLLTEIDAWYVSDDGTLDLTAGAYEANAKFSFTLPAPPPPPVDTSVPLGARRTDVRFAPGTSCFQIDRNGISKDLCAEASAMRLFGESPVPRPTCSLRAVWAAALAAGAPAKAVAHITYKRALLAKSSAWHFVIADTPHTYFVSDPGCQVVKDPSGF
jgi:hypothetical protein